MIITIPRLCAWVAIVTAFFFGSLQLGASNVTSSCTVVQPVTDSTSTASNQPSPALAAKLKKTRKYELDRIGQRNMGKGVNLYSLEKERSLGAKMAAAVDLETIAASDGMIKDYLNRLGQKSVRSSDAQFPFIIKVIDSKNPTVFSLPGGFLYIDVGLLLDVDSEAELAGLMAHEIAHSVARHATRIATRRFALDLLLSFPITRMIGPWALPVRQLGMAPIEKKLYRDSEFEADLLGIEYQFAAGYDPQAYVEVLEKLDHDELETHARASNRPKPGFLSRLNQNLAHTYSDYPATEQRILKLQGEISTLLPCRDNYIVDTDEFQEAKAQLGAARLVLERRRPGDKKDGGPVLERHPSSK
jgi:predicted Zn-dependent protease